MTPQRINLQEIRKRLETLKELTSAHDLSITDFSQRKRASEIANLPIAADLSSLLTALQTCRKSLEKIAFQKDFDVGMAVFTALEALSLFSTTEKGEE